MSASTYAVVISCLLSPYFFTPCSCLLRRKDSCPLWQVMKENGKCECGETYNGIVSCDKNFVYIVQGNCLTWNNSTSSAEVHSCLFSTLWNFEHICGNNNTSYRVSMNISGDMLNYVTCGGYNRKGTQCRQCIDGYGPAAYSDGVSCADCSKHKHLWILNLLFQLLMVTLMYIMLIPLQISAASSPYNIIIMYVQLSAITLKLDGALHVKMFCLIGKRFTNLLITILDIWNLDFFHLIIPPLCISTSFKAINTLLLDYIIAVHPLIFSAFIYLCIELHDRNNRIIAFLSYPIRKCVSPAWNPKRSILNTFTTFCLLSYSKFLFVSINLLLAVQLYSSHGKVDLKVLFYDPTIRYFHSEHIPYVVLASLFLVIFISIPPLFLLLYYTKAFRKCLQLFKIRWDILNHIMDIFQGWCKDGTEGTRDYRFISGFYFFLRIFLVCELAVILLMDYNHRAWFWEAPIPGVAHFMLGVFFFAAKPYKKEYMNHMDGLIFTIVGGISFIHTYDSKPLYILCAGFGCLFGGFTLLYAVFVCIKRFRSL